jgi:radical SAM superfamily enzyme YgiQ (UPF0313 family)
MKPEARMKFMARILIISCNFAVEPYPVFPLGAAMVAGAMRRLGHEARLWDPLARGATLDEAVDVAGHWKPDIIGLSIRNIDNTSSTGFQEYRFPDRDLVGALRQRSGGATIVLGGAGYSIFPETLLRRSGADYGVVGEGESVMAELADALAAGRPPAERILRPRAPLPPEAIASRPGEDDPVEYYLREGSMLSVQSKRGCPFRCSYCTYPLLEGRSYRARPAADVAADVEFLHRAHGAQYVAFVDSVFNDAEGQYLAVAEELARRALDVRWMAFMRPARFTPQEAALLRRAGLDCVEWGTDGTTDATLAALGKPFLWEDVLHSRALFAREGIRGAHFVIFGGPEETETTAREGLSNVERLAGDVVMACRGVRILPGTTIQRRAVDEGVIAPDDDLFQARFYHSPGIDPQKLDREIRQAFEGRIDRLYPTNCNVEKVRLFHRMGYRGPIWDLLLKAEGRKTRSVSATEFHVSS